MNKKELASKLEAKKGFNMDIIMGLDGMVDKIISVVDKRQDPLTFTRIETIADFGARISRAAGLSTNVELVVGQTKLGGNGPIMANALLEAGFGLNYVGCLGKPDIHPVFQPFVKRSKKAYSICEPGYTNAMEFNDGKIMMGEYAHLAEMTWDVMKEAMGGAAGVAKLIDESVLFGMENWTMIPFMSEIWEGIITEVLPLMKPRDVKPLAFFDIADPEKRTKEDIARAMKLIGKFEEKFRAILGLNEKELYQIAEVLGIAVNESDADEVKMQKAVEAVYAELGIYCLVVHPVRTACCCIGGEYAFVEGPYCAKPKLTTGAGDNFNAGFVLGQALGMSPIEALTMGVSTSGFYVRNARSPVFAELIGFIGKWADGSVD